MTKIKWSIKFRSVERRLRKKAKKKGRIPGTVRKSRMPGGSGFRGWLAWEG